VKKLKGKGQKTKGERRPSDPVRQPRDLRLHLHGGNVYAFARARGIAPESVFDFSASINPLGCPPQVERAYHHALSRVTHYPEPYAETLTHTLAEYHALHPGAVLVGNGSTQLIYLLARTLAARRVLCIAPLFSEHEAAFRLSGVQVEHFLLRPPCFILSLERLGLVLMKKYDVVALTNPNSPTGTLVPRAQMAALVQLCQRTHTTLIIDETFIDWVEEASLKQIAARSPQIIVLRSLTKFFALPGLRVGYMVAQPQWIKRLRTQIEPWSVNTVAQEVAGACVQAPQFVQRSREFIVHERAWLFEQVAAIAGLQPFPSQANFLLVRLATKTLNAPLLAQRLATENILIRSCHNFRGLGKQFFRVAVRTREENACLLAALRKVCE
jgi:threonine-phosphate decarboxylase